MQHSNCIDCDKFLEVRLNIKYELCVTTNKVKVLITVCWLTGIITFIVMAFVKNISSMIFMDKIILEVYHGDYICFYSNLCIYLLQAKGGKKYH